MPIERYASLRDQVYAHIRHQIITQQYNFGQKINIADLARELNVSNTPIREALSKLENDGLIVNVPNVGVSVTPMTKEIFLKHTQAISALLIGCYIDCINANKQDKLISLLESRFEHQKKLSQNGFSEEYTLSALNFDRAFIDACDNELLSDTFNARMDWLILSTLHMYKNDENGIKHNLDEHEMILSATKSGDAREVTQLLFTHLQKQPYKCP